MTHKLNAMDKPRQQINMYKGCLIAIVLNIYKLDIYLKEK